MRFTPKKKEILIEADINPLEVNSVDLSYDEQYTQAIMKAVASESGAIVEYEQILALEPNVTKKSLVELFHDTLIDIKDEEVKHLAQLNTKLSEVPTLKDSYKDGEEEAESGKDIENEDVDETEKKQNESIKESVDILVPAERMYSAEEITKIILAQAGLDYTNNEFMIINEILDPTNKDILTAEEVDEGISNLIKQYEFTEDEISDLENSILYSKDPTKPENEEMDIKTDLDKLEDIQKELYSQEIKDKLQTLIDELKNVKNEVL